MSETDHRQWLSGRWRRAVVAAAVAEAAVAATGAVCSCCLHPTRDSSRLRKMADDESGCWRVRRRRRCRAGAIRARIGLSKDAGVDSSYFSPHRPVQCVEHFGTDCCHLTRDERREQKPAQLMPRELQSRVTWAGRAFSCPTPEPGSKQRQPSQFTTFLRDRVV